MVTCYLSMCDRAAFNDLANAVEASSQGLEELIYVLGSSTAWSDRSVRLAAEAAIANCTRCRRLLSQARSHVSKAEKRERARKVELDSGCGGFTCYGCGNLLCPISYPSPGLDTQD